MCVCLGLLGQTGQQSFHRSLARCGAFCSLPSNCVMICDDPTNHSRVWWLVDVRLVILPIQTHMGRGSPHFFCLFDGSPEKGERRRRDVQLVDSETLHSTLRRFLLSVRARAMMMGLVDGPPTCAGG